MVTIPSSDTNAEEVEKMCVFVPKYAIFVNETKKRHFSLEPHKEFDLLKECHI